MVAVCLLAPGVLYHVIVRGNQKTFFGDSNGVGLWPIATYYGPFLGFAGARVLGIRPIVEGVQSVANRLE